ncbi:MAG: NAD-dependent epimerase/dehydratase family protein [Methylococcales bacterium]
METIELNNKTTILVTGGAGFIGRHLVSSLLDHGCSVRVLDDMSTGQPELLPIHPNLEVVVGSVLDLSAVSIAMEGTDLIFHLASVVGMQVVHSAPTYSIQVSVEGTQNVFAESHEQPVILFSSSAVYGINSDGPVKETMVVNEQIVLKYDGGVPGYGVGKFRMEQIGLEAAKNGRKVIILRPFNVVGLGQSPRYGMVLPSFLKCASIGKPLLIHDDGLQERAFGDVETLVEAVLRLVPCQQAWDQTQNIINIGNTQCHTILELAHMVINAMNAKNLTRFIPYSEVFPGKTDVRKRRPDVSRLEGLIGVVQWQPLGEIVAVLAEETRRLHSLKKMAKHAEKRRHISEPQC